MNKSEITQFLKNLQNEMCTQDTDIQADPRFWTLMDYQMIPGNIDSADGWVVSDDSGEPQEITALAIDIKEEIEGARADGEDPIADHFNGERTAKTALDRFPEDTNPEYQLKWIATYGPAVDMVHGHAQALPMQEIAYIVPNTLFLTKQEAQDYLTQYGYNHSSKAHTYAMTALRSPAVSTLYTIIQETDWDAFDNSK